MLKLDGTPCNDFTVSFHMSLEIFGREPVVNFDESRWRIVMTGSRTVAERGSESVKRFINGDVKASFSFFACVKADGTQLPLWLIAQGRTPRCRRQLGVHPGHVYDIWYSPAGWCHEQLMTAYLDWLWPQLKAPVICLILDQ
jgi:hypothetical protein